MAMRPCWGSGLPQRWRGDLPDPTVRRTLARVGDWVSVPAPLLCGGFPDLGVLVWALLRLSFGRKVGRASYSEFADRLGLQHSLAGGRETSVP